MSSLPSSLSFLPVHLLQRLHGTDGLRPKVETFPAAVLYVDVSRYSSLVEQMVNRGKQGLEQIPELLDRCYTQCAEHVHDLGGEVAQFAGDSLVAYWSAERGLFSAQAAATECAKRICVMAPVQLESRTASFHAGVGTGLLWAAAVGGTNRHWSLLVGGPAFRRAAAAHSRARPGHFEVFASNGSDLTGSSEPFPSRAVTELGPRLVTDTSPCLEWMTEFLPVRFDQLLASNLGMSRERSGGLTALSEFRPVTVLFCRFEGLDETQPHSLAAHQTLCESLQSVVTSEDGPLGELLIDDKGLVFHTVFGEPGSFHKDDGVRGLSAALGIVEASTKLGWACSVGVASGEALFRAVGPPRRRVFMTLGTVMNRAARLMSAASAGVLCDGATERICNGRLFEFNSAGPFMLGGIGQTYAGFRPSRKTQSAPVTGEELGAIIGREVEMEWLRQLLDESHPNQRRLVMVVGEAGIGKSRLLKSFAQSVRERGRLVSFVNIERGDWQRLLVPWRSVLEALLGKSSGSDRTPLEKCLGERFAGHEFEQRLPLLAAMLSCSMEDTESTGHLVGANRADATMRFVVDIIEVLAPPGLVIVLEDCQWMDSASWRVAEWLVRRVPSLMLVMSVRQEESPKEYRVLLRRIEETRFQSSDVEGDVVARAARVLDLERLTDMAVREVVVRTLGGLPVAEELARSICVMARGNPLFAEESGLALRSEGLIAVVNGRWNPITSMERLESGRLERFDAIERVVRERVDHLDPVEQLVLKAASIIGRVFDARVVQTLLDNEVSAQAITDSLAELECRRLVVVVDEPSGMFQFWHDHMRDVVYESIPGATKQRLHRCFATYLEEKRGEIQRVDFSTLVRHWDAAGDVEKSVSYANAAAIEALRSGSFREAEEFLRLCLAKTNAGSSCTAIQRIRWQRALAEAHYGRGNVSAQGEAVKGALFLARQYQPRTRPALLGRLGLEISRTATQQLLPSFFSRMPSEEQRVFQLEVFRCHSQAAIFYYFNQDRVRCMLSSFAAVNAVDRCGERSDLVRAYAQIGCALGVGGYPRFASHFFGKAQRVAELEGNPTVLAYALLLEALYRVGHGTWDAVRRDLDRSQELSTTAGDHVTWCNAQMVRFWMYTYRGQRDDAERTAELLLARAQNSGNIQQEIWALRAKSLSALAGDRPRHAVDLLRMALAALPKSSDLSELILSRGCLALALTRSGDHKGGVEEAVATVDLLKKRNRATVHSNLAGSSAVAEVLLRGRQEGLSKAYPEWNHWEAITLREIDRHRRAFPVASARYGLWHGLSLWLNGQRGKAVQTWCGALTFAQQMGLRQDEALLAAELRYWEEL